MERELQAGVDESSRVAWKNCGTAHPGSTPSRQAVRPEQSVLLAEALERLTADYREVIILRHLEQLPFSEVATKMAKTEDSVQKLWVRAAQGSAASRWGRCNERPSAERAGPRPATWRCRPGVSGRPRLGSEAHCRQELIARNPDIAADLSACLQGLSFLESAAGQIDRDVALPTGAHDRRIEVLSRRTSRSGDFKLIKEIGRGGMGVVYEAQQLSLGRAWRRGRCCRWRRRHGPEQSNT